MYRILVESFTYLNVKLKADQIGLCSHGWLMSDTSMDFCITVDVLVTQCSVPSGLVTGRHSFSRRLVTMDQAAITTKLRADIVVNTKYWQ